MAKDAPTPLDGGDGPDQSEEARKTRMKQGPMQVFLPPDFERNPALPPEVWPSPPPGVEPPK